MELAPLPMKPANSGAPEEERMVPKLFIFDFDGTLVDSAPLVFEYFNKAAARFGFHQKTTEELEALRDQDNRAVIRALGIKWWRIPQISKYMRDVTKEAEPAPFFPGIGEMLRHLHANGRTLAIVSSNSEEGVRRALGPDYEALFQVFACSASIFGKASKFKEILRKTKTRPCDAISIADETRDIEAARKLRLCCGAVSWGYHTPDILKSLEPDFLFTQPSQIMELVR